MVGTTTIFIVQTIRIPFLNTFSHMNSFSVSVMSESRIFCTPFVFSNSNKFHLGIFLAKFLK